MENQLEEGQGQVTGGNLGTPKLDQLEIDRAKKGIRGPREQRMRRAAIKRHLMDLDTSPAEIAEVEKKLGF